MNNERMLYISPDEDLPAICTRLEHAHSRRVTLVMPLHTRHFHAFGTWRMLHAYARRRGITVHIVSASAYIRSIAHNARFTVAKTLDVPQEKRLYTRPSTHMPSLARSHESMKVGEGVNLVFLDDDQSSIRLAQPFPDAHAASVPHTLMFINDDVLVPPHPSEPPVRVSKPPQPLNMPLIRRTRPLTQPRLPWDDVDDDALPPQPPHKLIRRRTNPLVQSMRRKGGAMREIRRRRETTNVISLSPILCIGIFIVVRSIVQYVRKRTL